MILGCIDIGSNTTRLLVAEAMRGSLRPLMADRAFTRIGSSLDEDGMIPPEKMAETASVVRAQARAARELGAREVVGVATAAIRDAGNCGGFAAAVEAELGSTLRVLSDAEEARLSFVGATRTLDEAPPDTMAVVDVGGGSTEIAVGSPGGEVSWWRSLRVGSGLLADLHLRSDPPSAGELDAVRAHVAEAFEGLDAPRARSAVAVGGTATSLRRLLGSELEHAALARGVRGLAELSIADAAARFDLDPERVRLLPAGILVLAEVSRCLGLPLRIARGGLREGVILELMDRYERGEG